MLELLYWRINFIFLFSTLYLRCIREVWQERPSAKGWATNSKGLRTTWR